jgi:isoleucyl-tRNA synthetase
MDFGEEEKKILKFWKDNKIFEKSISQRKNGKIFNFFDGPPFATGSPHYGHILASTIKDVIPRYWTMKGYYVPRRWGWDCHGLPIENIVEQKLNISGKKQIEEIGINKFNKTCRENVLTYTKEWGKMVDRIGRFIDFKNSYKTMDNNYIESVWWALKEIYKKGLIYQGRKVLLYCPRCETPISNFEVAMDNSYKDLEEESVTIKFKAKDSKNFGVKDGNLYFLAWTTTPWTLPANAALAISLNLDYILAKQNKEFYILAESRKEILKSDFQILKKFKGKNLVGLEYESLYAQRDSSLRPAGLAQNDGGGYKVLSADFVTAQEGTGIVHIAPVYGEDDYNLGLKFDLPIIPLLDSKGIFNKQAPKFIQGQYFKKANKLIKDDLSKRDIVYKIENTIHSYPFCWRCGAMLFYNAIPAWFINIQKIKGKLIKHNKKINWYPSHLQKGRFQKGIESAPDWTISRNRYWASPLPIWKCAKCGQLEVIGSKKDLLKQKFSTNKYFVLRHGESECHKNETAVSSIGKNLCPLTNKGKQHIKRVAKELKKQKIDIIFSSDLLRTKQTAEIVGKEMGIKVKFDKRLREIKFGIYDGNPIKEWIDFWKSRADRFTKRPPKGENYKDVKDRVGRFLKIIDKKYKGKNILIVSHGGPILMMNSIMKGFSREQVLSLDTFKKMVKVGDWHKLDFKILPYNADGELDFHRPYIDEVKFMCAKCGEKMERVPEVIDCWVESASMPFAELHYPFENKNYFQKRFPAQFVSEYIAQTRAWFYVMHAISCILFDKPPFKNVVATGTILNEKGEKLSKSKNNFPDPKSVLEKYGADALRIYLMSSPVMKGEDLYFSEQELKENYQKVILLLLNVFSFYKEYQLPLSGNVKAEHILDKWILSRLNCLKREVYGKMDNYDVVSSSRAIKDFISDISLWYLRRSRDRFKKGDKQGIKVFKFVLFELSKIMASFTPFISEYIYQKIGGKKQSVHLEDLPKINKKLIDEKLDEQMEVVREIVGEALAQRAEAGIKVRQPLALLRIKNYDLKFKNNEELLGLIKDEINVKDIVFDSKIKNKIELDIKITPELKEQGIVREVIRGIQGMRKSAGYKPRHKILIRYFGNAELNKILSRNTEFILMELTAKDFLCGKRPKQIFDIEKEFRIDNQNLWLGIKKI